MRRSRRTALAGAAAAFLVATGVAGANVALTRVSTDPYTNATSQHATEVEPDTFADHGTVVATFQVGRFFNGGATDIGFVRSGDGGATWDAPGFLPGMTFSSGCREPVRAGQRPERGLRRRARRLADLLDPDPAEHAACRPCSSTARRTTAGPGARRCRSRRRPRIGRPGQELDGLRQRSRRARSAATATPSSTTSATATSS